MHHIFIVVVKIGEKPSTVDKAVSCCSFRRLRKDLLSGFGNFPSTATSLR